ncbi:MAG: Gfo/Idh/MocA family oxidoreductase [Solirubrobacterales bacterium]|nr:Gfo/Idh/MocA family oxidoreductase [Solirubrobacterales bacterium]
MSSRSTGSLNWGILSTAEINDELLPGFRDSPAADLRAVASRDLSRARAYADEHGIPDAYGSYEELLADGSIDCVYIPVPNSLHGKWTRAALEAGKHVLCEKPMTPTRKEAEELFELAEERGLSLMEAFMYRQHPAIRKLREIVTDGRLGDIQVVRSWFHYKAVDPATDIRYRTDLAGGSLRDVGCYCLNFSTYIYGRAPDQVCGFAGLADSGVDEYFAATLSFGSGSLAVFDCGMNSPLSMGARIMGSLGNATVAMPWYPHLGDDRVELEVDGKTELVQVTGGNSYRLEIENFCAAVSGEEEPEVTREETLRNLGAMERLAESARVGSAGDKE